MRHPQIVVLERDGWLAAQIADLARESGWLVRESRRPDACLEFLRESRPAILLLRLENQLVDEMALLAALHEKAPDCLTALFSDVKMENAGQRCTLAGLAYDLGARFVMFPPLSRHVIEDVAAGMMAAAIQRGLRPQEVKRDA